MGTVVGQRRVLRQAATVDRSQVAVTRGVRNAVGVFLPLAVGVATGEVADGAAVAVGALFVGVTEVGAPYARRVRTMLLASALVAASTFVGRLTGQVEWLNVVFIAVWGFGAGLTYALGRTASIVGTFTTVSLLSFAVPAGLDDALLTAGLAFAGGVLETALAVAIWPLRPYGPERAATASAYEAVSDFVAAIAARAEDSERISALTSELDKARALLDDAEGRALGMTAAGEAFRTLLVQADRIYPEAVALAHLRRELPAAAAVAGRNALDVTAVALRAVAVELRGGHAAEVDDLRARLRAATETIATYSDGAGPHAAARLAAIRGQLRAAVDAALAWDRRGRSRVQRPVLRGRAWIPYDAISVLRANLTLGSSVCRHAVRLAAALAVAVAVYRIFDLPRGYWVALTVIVVLRPDFASTFSRGLQRYAGHRARCGRRDWAGRDARSWPVDACGAGGPVCGRAVRDRVRQLRGVRRRNHGVDRVLRRARRC
jgi:uncharacterized membrane protein YccC